MVDQVNTKIDEVTEPVAKNLKKKVETAIENSDMASPDDLDRVITAIENEYEGWHNFVRESLEKVSKELGRDGLMKMDENISGIFGNDD